MGDVGGALGGVWQAQKSVDVFRTGWIGSKYVREEFGGVEGWGSGGG